MAAPEDPQQQQEQSGEQPEQQRVSPFAVNWEEPFPSFPPFYITREQLHDQIDVELVGLHSAVFSGSVGSVVGGLTGVLLSRGQRVEGQPPAPGQKAGSLPQPRGLLNRYARGSVRGGVGFAAVGFAAAMNMMASEPQPAIQDRVDRMLGNSFTNGVHFAVLGGTAVGAASGATIFARSFAGAVNNVPRRFAAAVRGSFVFTGIAVTSQVGYYAWDKAGRDAVNSAKAKLGL